MSKQGEVETSQKRDKPQAHSGTHKKSKIDGDSGSINSNNVGTTAEDSDNMMSDLKNFGLPISFTTEDKLFEFLSNFTKNDFLKFVSNVNQTLNQEVQAWINKYNLDEKFQILECGTNTAEKSREKRVCEHYYNCDYKDSVVIYHTDKFDKVLINYFERDASTFKEVAPRLVSDTPKTPFYRMFLGSSGSGKSFASLKYEFKYNTKCKYCLTVYLAASEVIRDFYEADFDDNDQKLRKGNVFISLVCKMLQEILFERPNLQDNSKLEDMILHLVIDEAGFREVDLKDFSWSIKDVSRLRLSIIKFVGDVKVTAAGTNLDYVTSDIVDSSNNSVTKYRATPWNLTNAFATIEGIRKKRNIANPEDISAHEETLRKWIESVPIYSSLLTNGRAAYALIGKLLELSVEGRDGSRLVQYVVDTVAKYYIGENGLANLKKIERRIVVKAILEVLTAEDVEKAAFISFNLPPGKEYLLKNCLSIVDSNVEKKGESPKYINTEWKCPCTVSPCLAIVLFDLLDFSSTLCNDWESFETVCQLGLIQDTVKKIDVQCDFRLIKMVNPFPHTSAKRRGFVPLIKPHDIIHNGRAASHGDVFANYEIVQSKHSLDRDKVQVKFLDEVYKSGLYKDDDKSIQAAVTTLLHKQWNEKSLQGDTNQMEKTSEKSKHIRSNWYPASLLEFEREKEYDVVSFDLLPDENIIELQNKSRFEIAKKFDPAITYSICTNANKIELCLRTNNIIDNKLDPEYSQTSTESQNSIESHQDEHESVDPITITPEDVYFNGNLKEEKPGLRCYLKEGVNLRFQFCQGM